MLGRALVLTALTLGVVAAPAGAATYSASGLSLTVAPLPGEANRVVLQITTVGQDTFWLVTNDVGAPVTAGSFCSQLSTVQVRCSINGTVNFALGDGDDKVTKDTPGHGGTIHGDAGNDTLNARDNTVANLFGDDGDDFLEAVGTLADIYDGGNGNDQIRGSGSGADVINGGAGTDTFLVAGGAWTVSLDDAANDGIPGTNVSNVHSDMENISGGQFSDELSGSAGPNALRGGGSGDKLDGKGGSDSIFGETGDDTITARDGSADTIDCGDGNDTVAADPQDILIACETATYADTDRDGSPANVDCNDNNAAIHPGATDIPGNGVDEDCSGADAPFPDADRDGSPANVDCNDSDAAIHPGATDVPDNGIDEDCSGADTVTPVATPMATPAPVATAAPAAVTPAPTPPPAPLDSVITVSYRFAKTYTLFDEIVIRNARAGSTITLKCSGKGCPKTLKPRTVTKDAAKLRIAKPVGKAKLRVGTRLEVRVERAGSSVGARYTVRPNRKPTRKDL